MQTSSTASQPRIPTFRLEEVVLGALAAPPGVKPASPAPAADDGCVQVEIIDDDPYDTAATLKFVKLSTPYERVDIAPLAGAVTAGRPRSTTFARTVARGHDSVWFDQPIDAVAHLEDSPAAEPTDSWWWLASSLAAAAVANAAILW